MTNFIFVSSFTSIQNPCGQWKLGQDDSCKGVSNTPLLIHMTSNFHTNVHVCDKSNNLTLATSNNCEQFGYMLSTKELLPKGGVQVSIYKWIRLGAPTKHYLNSVLLAG